MAVRNAAGVGALATFVAVGTWAASPPLPSGPWDNLYPGVASPPVAGTCVSDLSDGDNGRASFVLEACDDGTVTATVNRGDNAGIGRVDLRTEDGSLVADEQSEDPKVLATTVYTTCDDLGAEGWKPGMPITVLADVQPAPGGPYASVKRTLPLPGGFC